MRGRVDSLGTNYLESKETIWDRITGMIEQLFDMRLVQHLAMPTEKAKRQILLSRFRQKMNVLHFTLKEVRAQTHKNSDSHETRDKNVSKAAYESKYFQHRKGRIKQVENMYTQLFFEGSFKHYQKVAHMLGFLTNMDPIDIQEWAKNCQIQEPQDEKCCCEEGGCCCKGSGCRCRCCLD